MNAVAVTTHTLARTHTAVFVSDKLRNFLKLLVRYYGLDPQGVLDAWSEWADRAVRTWLESGHLEMIIIEFYWPGRTTAEARWEFPIRYDGNGVDEMWVDRLFFEGALAKAPRPPAGCSYRIALRHSPGEPPVPGVGPITLRSTGSLVAREVGTIVATPDIMASARYYR
jgi:hypothetical protein